MHLAKLSAAILLLLGVPLVVRGQPWTLQLDVRGQRIEGTPLRWTDEMVFLLGRDGKLWKFSYNEAQNHRKISSVFQAYSYSQLRGRLQQEFGDQFDITGSSHYIVLHQSGRLSDWATRFEQMYRSFVRYFLARGFQLREPEFPLVVVVFGQQRDFLRYASRDGVIIGTNVLGYYSPKTNRILIYDRAAQTGNQSSWPTNAETIIHEAAHQTAFNTGIHDRFTPLPRWVGEGLGTMFEAKGVWDSPHHPRQDERINRPRLASFKEYAKSRRRKGVLAELISSDRMFKSDPAGAYAEAWALTFFLAETQSEKYFRYLKKTASRPRFVEYRQADRLQDFVSIFGSNLSLLEANYLRYIDRQK